MDELGITSINTGVIISQVAVTAFVVLIIILVIAFLVFVWWISQYNKVKFVVRRIADNRVVIVEDKARIIKKKGQPIKWKLFKLKDYVPVPPDKAIEITKSQGVPNPVEHVEEQDLNVSILNGVKMTKIKP